MWKWTLDILVIIGSVVVTISLVYLVIILPPILLKDVHTQHVRRKRKRLGLCVKCGYDLRASKDRCPECGCEFEKP